MCDVCEAEGVDWRFKNGNRGLQKVFLYKVYVGQVATFNICHIHGIELFRKGEAKFLQSHLAFARKVATEKSHFSVRL